MWRYAENTRSAERGATLLSRLETIERNADFFSNVSLDGPRIPEGIAAKLLYAFNAMDKHPNGHSDEKSNTQSTRQSIKNKHHRNKAWLKRVEGKLLPS
jgi:hypothetical protein